MWLGGKMRINDKLLSLPPYISTSWDYVCSLQIENATEEGTCPILMVTLTDGQRVSIPNLSRTLLDAIFSMHAKVIEHKSNEESKVAIPQLLSPFSQKKPQMDHKLPEFPLRFGFSNLEGTAAMLQHNPLQSDAPNLPQEILQKIAAVARALGIDDATVLPQFEQYCNCFHCQIARTIHQEFDTEQSACMEQVTEEDLKFCDWSIEALDDKLYSVISRIDHQDMYSVYLGDPLRCTCDKKNCEHIRAVLESDAGMA